jgi:hypothetical protein
MNYKRRDSSGNIARRQEEKRATTSRKTKIPAPIISRIIQRLFKGRNSCKEAAATVPKKKKRAHNSCARLVLG